jgi:hypothetical protein
VLWCASVRALCLKGPNSRMLSRTMPSGLQVAGHMRGFDGSAFAVPGLDATGVNTALSQDSDNFLVSLQGS